jgi:hypothetical protein
MSCSETSHAPVETPPVIGSPPKGGGTEYRSARRATEIRARRDVSTSRSTTRFGTNRFLHSPLWLVSIEWPDERCPTCGRPLPEETHAAFDEDEQACFCFACAYKWLDELDDDPEPPRPSQHPVVLPRDTQLRIEI